MSLLVFATASAIAWTTTTDPYSFSGNVGIGTTSPSEKFHIRNGNGLIDGNNWPRLEIRSLDANEDPRIFFKDSIGDYWSLNHDDSSGSQFQLRWRDVSSDPNELIRFRFETDGDFQAIKDIRSDSRIFLFGSTQRLYGDNSARIYYRSNNSTQSRISFLDKEDDPIGHVHGENSNGARFGLLDAAGQWAIQILEDNYIRFSIDNVEKMRIRNDGNVGIGTSTPGNKLEVNGTIRAKEVIVEATNWPDYVFEEGYERPTLASWEAHIKDKGHLPGFPSRAEAEAKGVSVSQIQKALLQKIEEMSLIMIEQQNVIQEQSEAIQVLRSEVIELKEHL